MSETQATPDAGNSFSRAFLPGLILGLVVGGFCGAFLPEIMNASKPEFDHAATTGEGSASEHDRDARQDEYPGEDDAVTDDVPEDDMTAPDGTPVESTEPGTAPDTGDEQP